MQIATTLARCSKFFLILSLMIFSQVAFSQAVNISNTTLNTCSATIYDNGGPSGNYTDPASGTTTVTMTICSNNGGPIYLLINLMNLSPNNFFGNGADNVIIYNGTGTGGTVLYNYLTGISPVAGYASSTGTCLTISFITTTGFGDPTVAAGFSITATCTKPQTCTDGILNNGEIMIDCGGPSCQPCYVFTACSPNVIQNGDFETSNVPVCTAAGGGIYGSNNQIPTPWYDQTPLAFWIGTKRRGTNTTISYPTADYFSNCTNAAPAPGMNGTGSLGYYARFNSQSSEYVQELLASPLIAGEEYCVSIRLFVGSGLIGSDVVASDGFGAWFHNRTFASGNGFVDVDADNGGAPFIGPGTIVNATPQVRQPPGSQIPVGHFDKKFTFCATGGEKYVVVGNFNPGSTGKWEYIIVDDFVVKQSCPLTFTSGITPSGTPNCSGSCVILTADASNFAGGCQVTNNVTYLWSTGATTKTVNVCPTVPTVYSVQMTYNAGCKTLTKTESITFCGPPGPTVTATNNTICPGGCNNITATGANGTAPYTYSWNPGSLSGASVNVCPASTTTYTVITTDGASATASTTAVVTVTPAPTVNITGGLSICAGQSTTLTGSGGGTYSWNTGAATTTITVTPGTTTTYSVTATTAGCTGSKLVTVNVTPKPVPTISGTTTICAGTSTSLTATGGGTYLWSTTETTPSITVTPGGNTTYTVTATNTGCTGSTTVAVTVAANLIPVITGVTTICNGTSTTLSTTGGGTYLWNDGTTNSSIIVSPTINPTSYSVTVTNGSCSGTASVQVTVNPNPTPTISGNTSVCSGMSTLLTASGGTTYVWDGGQTTPSITVSPTVQTTYTVTATTNGCTGQTSIVVGITPPPTPTITGTMAICIGGNTTLTANGGGTYLWNTGATSPSITVTPGTTTSYSVVVTTGCSASATAQVTVQSNLTPSITGNTTICNGQSTTLNTSGGGTYLWSDGTTNANIIVSPTSLTSYSVTVTSGLCSGTAIVAVMVNPNPSPTISGTTTICSGQSTTLTANAGGAYSWSPGGQTTPSITVNPTNPTNTYIVTVTTNGCTGSASTQVLVNPTPVPTITGNITICTGGATTLTEGSTGGPYTWSPGGEITPSITVTPNSTTTYVVSVTQNGCTGTLAQTVTVVPPVTAVIKGSNICIGDDVTLTGSGGNTYIWNTGATTKTITDNPSTTTTYTMVTATGSCADTTTYVVTVNPLPIPIASGDTTIDYGNSTPLISTGGGTYQWIPPTGLDCSKCANPIATPTASTQYCVIVKTTEGCTDSACVTVIVNLKCGFEGELFIPNGFSPNNDGQNDVLYVRGAGITGMYWVIYDRWGEKVFETTDPKQGWDGTYKGKHLDPAVFVYYLNVTCVTGDEVKQKGNVAIVK